MSRARTALQLRDATGRVLLQRRPPTGIWAALWSLPEAPDHATVREWFDAHAEGDYDRANALDPIAHGFTHYRLHLQPLRFEGAVLRARIAEDGLRWIAREELASLGIPAPVRKLLETHL